MPVSSSVFLNVTNIEKSLEFYRNVGFRVAKTYKDDEGKVAWADLSLQGAEFGLGHIPSNDDPGFRQWVGTPLGAGVIVYFTVPNVDRYHKLAKDARATIEMDITDRPYGRMFTLNDPDGYTISFIEEVAKGAKSAKGAKRVTAKRAPAKSAPKAKGAKRVAAKRKAR
ncbi:MAG TPA: VOC family protein [Candidatus Thermoplasmatota archaeon]|nr:VOC family protein [Candidatus Thermoplasmatota archaeon]